MQPIVNFAIRENLNCTYISQHYSFGSQSYPPEVTSETFSIQDLVCIYSKTRCTVANDVLPRWYSCGIRIGKCKSSSKKHIPSFQGLYCKYCSFKGSMEKYAVPYLFYFRILSSGITSVVPFITYFFFNKT